MKATTGKMPTTPIPLPDPMVALYRPIAAATPKMIIHSILDCLLTAGKALVGRRSTSANAHTSMIIRRDYERPEEVFSGNNAFTV